MKTNNLARHGDLSFRAIEKIEGDAIKHDGSFVLALGEHTGHKHVITTEKPQDMEIFRAKDGRYIIRLASKGTLTHEEHKPIEFEAGIYEMRQEREFDYALGETRKVID